MVYVLFKIKKKLIFIVIVNFFFFFKCFCLFTLRPPSTAKSVSISTEDPNLQLDRKGESTDTTALPLGGVVEGCRSFKPRQSSVRSAGSEQEAQ